MQQCATLWRGFATSSILSSFPVHSLRCASPTIFGLVATPNLPRPARHWNAGAKQSGTALKTSSSESAVTSGRVLSFPSCATEHDFCSALSAAHTHTRNRRTAMGHTKAAWRGARSAHFAPRSPRRHRHARCNPHNNLHELDNGRPRSPGTLRTQNERPDAGRRGYKTKPPSSPSLFRHPTFSYRAEKPYIPRLRLSRPPPTEPSPNIIRPAFNHRSRWWPSLPAT